jgi:hypothetical protein
VLQPGGALDVAGIRFWGGAPGARREGDPLSLTRLGIGGSVLVEHATVARMAGGRASTLPDLAAEALFAAGQHVSYIALGGRHLFQRIQSNACASGCTGPIWKLDPGAGGGVLVELDDATGALLALTRVIWDVRPHRSATIDAAGLDADALAAIVANRLVGLAQPDEQTRAIVNLVVRGANCEFADLGIDLESGDQLATFLTWNGASLPPGVPHRESGTFDAVP